jgi:uncharacterized membrane protein
MSQASPHRSVMIVLAYLWPLALIPLLLEDKDTEVRWHARHGLVLTLAELALVIVYMTVMTIVSLAALPLGILLALLLVFAWVGILAVHVVAILKGVNGGRLVLPRLSALADREL